MFNEVSKLILSHLDKISDIHAENWNDLKWETVTKVMLEVNSPGNCKIAQHHVSDFYDRVFYEKFIQ